MHGIDLERPIKYTKASLRFFSKNEHHISRICKENVLLLVYEGILRFSEDGVEYEVGPGEYHIQKRNTVQHGNIASDAPKYLWVHFHAYWTDSDNALPARGSFDYETLRPSIERLDKLAHSNATYIEQSAVFYNILLSLNKKEPATTLAGQIADFISKEYLCELTLETICQYFNFSKNHIINVFKEEYGQTPFAYLNNLRLSRAEYLLEVTSDTIEEIAFSCSFHHYSHFYRLFRRKNGISPEQWRQKKRLYLSSPQKE